MPDAPHRIQRLRTKGWKLPTGVVYVGRPSPFGNRCKIEQVDGIGWCVTDTETGLTTECGTLAAAHTAAVTRFWNALAAQPELMDRIRRDLRGKPLCCYCPPHLACHADVLLEVANA